MMSEPREKDIIARQAHVSDEKSQRLRVAFILIIIVSLLLAFAIRFHNLGHSSLWLDEVLQLNSTRVPFSKIWQSFPPGAPPLDYYIQWFFLGSDTDEMHVRLHACLLGSAVVAAIGLWGMAMGGWALSLISIAVSLGLPLLVRFSQEGRPYALMLLSECLFLAAFWTIVRSTRPFRPALWILLSASVVLCLWSSYLSVIVCMVSAVFAFVWWLLRKDRRKRIGELLINKRRLLIPLVLIGIALLSGLPIYVRALSDVSQKFYAPFDGWSAARVRMYLDIYAMGYEWFQYASGTGWILILLAAVGWLGWALRRGYAAAAHFCAFVFITIFFGTFILCKLFNHWMEVRYTLAALPPAIMLASMGIESISRGGALLIRATGLKSRATRSIAFATIATLMSLAVASLLIYYVFTNPVKRSDWRGLGQRLKAESMRETMVVVGDYLDEVVLRHYFKRYEIPAQLVVANYDSTVLNNVLSSNNDVWVVIRPEEIRPQFIEALSVLPREYRPFLRLDVRRNLPPIQLAERRPEFKRAIIGPSMLEATIHPGREDCFYLGRGWASPEHWGKVKVRAIDGTMGELFLPLSEPVQLNLTFRVYPFEPEREPPLQLALKINNVALDPQPVGKWWNELSWVVSEEILRTGLNEVLLIPNRALSPMQVTPPSGDYRKLSVWVEKISVVAY
jgi:hypothetical protein